MLEKIGFKNTDKLLIVNADDYRIAQCANQAINKLFAEHAITSTSVMMPPAKWSKEITSLPKQNKHTSIGIHLTLTNKFRPVSRIEDVSTLVNSDGFFEGSSEYIELR